MDYYKKIREYYDSSQILYRYFCYGSETLGMHFGFWDNKTKDRYEAIVNQDQAIIEVGKVKKEFLILDAGSGIGSTAIHIAKKTGAKVTGITLSNRQVKLANKYAKKAGVSQLTTFLAQNYIKTSFPDNYFDIVYGNESICYATPKSTFLREAYRVLKPGGKIIIADGYSSKKPSNKIERQIIANFIKNFALKELITPSEMAKAIKKSGFKNVLLVDKTKAVKPSVNDFYKTIQKLRIPLTIITHLPLQISKALKQNITSITCAYEGMKIGLAAYYIHYAEKP